LKIQKGCWKFNDKKIRMGKKKYKVLAIILTSKHEWMRKLAKYYNEFFMSSENEIEIIIKDPNYSIQKEIKFINKYTNRGIDILICFPIDEQKLEPIIKDVRKKGVFVITQGGHIKSENVSVCTADEEIGITAAQEFKRWWNKNRKNEIVNLLVLDCPKFVESQKRATFFIKELNSPHKFNAVNIISKDCSGSYKKSVQCCKNFLKGYMDINFVYGINDDCALGALNVARKLGKANIAVSGVGGDSTAINELQKPLNEKKGGFAFTIQISPRQYVKTIFNVFENLLDNKRCSKSVKVPIEIVNRNNIFSIRD
jgi:ABC-type sugar transport system substrate-binding protein